MCTTLVHLLRSFVYVLVIGAVPIKLSLEGINISMHVLETEWW